MCVSRKIGVFDKLMGCAAYGFLSSWWFALMKLVLLIISSCPGGVTRKPDYKVMLGLGCLNLGFAAGWWVRLPTPTNRSRTKYPQLVASWRASFKDVYPARHLAMQHTEESEHMEDEASISRVDHTLFLANRPLRANQHIFLDGFGCSWAWWTCGEKGVCQWPDSVFSFFHTQKQTTLNKNHMIEGEHHGDMANSLRPKLQSVAKGFATQSVTASLRDVLLEPPPIGLRWAQHSTILAIRKQSPPMLLVMRQFGHFGTNLMLLFASVLLLKCQFGLLRPGLAR